MHHTSLGDIEFYKKQKRIALRNCGVIDPEKIDEYIAFDGYKALGKCLTELSREEVIDIVKRSGLRGRGGAGFSTGTKWNLLTNPRLIKNMSPATATRRPRRLYGPLRY